MRVITGVELKIAVTLSKIGYGPRAGPAECSTASDCQVLRIGFCSVSSTLASWKHKKRLALKNAMRSRRSSDVSWRTVSSQSPYMAWFAR